MQKKMKRERNKCTSREREKEQRKQQRYANRGREKERGTATSWHLFKRTNQRKRHKHLGVRGKNEVVCACKPVSG